MGMDSKKTVIFIDSKVDEKILHVNKSIRRDKETLYRLGIQDEYQKVIDLADNIIYGSV